MSGKPLRSQALDLVGKNWSNASQTREKNLGNINRFCDMLEAKYGLESIHNLKAKHIDGVFEELRENRMSPSTIAGYATAARMIAEGIGKANIVPRSNAELGGSRAGHRLCPGVVNHETLQVVRDSVAKAQVWMGHAADMARDFGLRMQGATSKFSLVHKDGQDFLRVKEKGALVRHVPFENQRQVETARRAFEHMRQHGHDSLVPKDLTLKQGYNALRDAWSKAGGTKANDANFHKLRHGYIQARTNNDLGSMSRSEKQALCIAVGHFDISKLGHYSK